MDNCITENEEQRFRIEVSGVGNYNWKVQNIDYGIVREICLRIAIYLRCIEIFDGLPHRLVIIEEMAHSMISLEHYPCLGNQESICVVYEPWTNAIQVAITGLETMEALITLEDIAHIISLLRFPPEGLPELQ